MATYYVDPAGNDGNNGSSGTPWLTLQHAADNTAPGDTVTVRAGNYQGFNITISGTSGSPITFLALAGATINNPGAFGGLLFGINASGPSYLIIDGFTIAPQPADPLWDQGIRLGGIFPGGPTPHWALGNIIRNNAVHMRVVTIGDSSTNYDQLGIFTSWQDGLQVLNNTATGAWDSGIYTSNSAKNYTVRGNTVFNVGGNGIHNNGDAGAGPPGINVNAVIEDNVIHDVGFGIGGQAISCDGLQDSVIRNNLIYNAYSKGISLYVVNAGDISKNNVVVNNTVVVGINGSAGAAMRFPGGNYPNTAYNNIFLSAIVGGFSYDVDDLNQLTVDYNVIQNATAPGASFAGWQGYGADLHGFVATPAQLFVNPGSDFRLKSGSPAIDAGTATDAPAVDIAGTARPQGGLYDVGAYEFASTPPPPPPSPSFFFATAGRWVTGWPGSGF